MGSLQPATLQPVQTCFAIILLPPCFRQKHFYLPGTTLLCEKHVPSFLAPSPPWEATHPARLGFPWSWLSKAAGVLGFSVPSHSPRFSYMAPLWGWVLCWPGLSLSCPTCETLPSPGIPAGTKERAEVVSVPCTPCPGQGELWELRRALNSAETGTPPLPEWTPHLQGCGLCVLGRQGEDASLSSPASPFSQPPLHAEAPERGPGSGLGPPGLAWAPPPDQLQRNPLQVWATLQQTLNFWSGSHASAVLVGRKHQPGPPFHSVPLRSKDAGSWASGQNSPAPVRAHAVAQPVSPVVPRCCDEGTCLWGWDSGQEIGTGSNRGEGDRGTQPGRPGGERGVGFGRKGPGQGLVGKNRG